LACFVPFGVSIVVLNRSSHGSIRVETGERFAAGWEDSVNKFAIALLLGTVFAVGCGDKTDGAGSGSAKASGAPSASAKATASQASSGAPGGSAGSKVCDDYWAKYRACNEATLKAVPDGPAKESTKKTLEDSEKTIKDSWKDMKGEALDAACKMSMDALASNPNCPK